MDGWLLWRWLIFWLIEADVSFLLVHHRVVLVGCAWPSTTIQLYHLQFLLSISASHDCSSLSLTTEPNHSAPASSGWSRYTSCCPFLLGAPPPAPPPVRPCSESSALPASASPAQHIQHSPWRPIYHQRPWRWCGGEARGWWVWRLVRRWRRVLVIDRQSNVTPPALLLLCWRCFYFHQIK